MTSLRVLNKNPGQQMLCTGYCPAGSGLDYYNYYASYEGSLARQLLESAATLVGYGAMFLDMPEIGAVGAGILGVVAKGPLWSSTKNKSAVENAFGHFKKHGKEFPEFQNAKQYAEGAKRFLNDPPKGTLTKSNARGDTLREPLINLRISSLVVN